MATVLTVNFGWVLPVPGTEVDLWGIILNDTFGAVGGATPLDNIDTDLWTVKGTADGALQKSGGTMTGPLLLQVGPAVGQEAVSFNFLDTNYASLLDLIAYAPLASPGFSGNPTAPTPAVNDFDSSIATTAFVINQISAGGYAPLASPAFTGVPTAPTAALRTKTTQLATTDFAVKEVNTLVENSQIGTTYALVLTDAGKMLRLDNAAGVALTVPLDATVAFPTGTRIDVIQWGTGQVTVTPAGGVTLLSSGNKRKTTGQYSALTLWKVVPDLWVIIGDIAA